MKVNLSLESAIYAEAVVSRRSNHKARLYPYILSRPGILEIHSKTKGINDFKVKIT